MLKVGDIAPDFTVKLATGRDFHLDSVLENSIVLINLIRGTWCEECTNHLKTISTWKSKLQSKSTNITTIIITVEKEQVVRNWLKENPTPYLIACDENGSVAKSFGLMVPEDAYSMPGLILIDGSKRIRIISSDLKESRNDAASALEIDV